MHHYLRNSTTLIAFANARFYQTVLGLAPYNRKLTASLSFLLPGFCIVGWLEWMDGDHYTTFFKIKQAYKHWPIYQLKIGIFFIN